MRNSPSPPTFLQPAGEGNGMLPDPFLRRCSASAHPELLDHVVVDLNAQTRTAGD